MKINRNRRFANRYLLFLFSLCRLCRYSVLQCRSGAAGVMDGSNHCLVIGGAHALPSGTPTTWQICFFTRCRHVLPDQSSCRRGASRKSDNNTHFHALGSRLLIPHAASRLIFNPDASLKIDGFFFFHPRTTSPQ